MGKELNQATVHNTAFLSVSTCAFKQNVGLGNVGFLRPGEFKKFHIQAVPFLTSIALCKGSRSVLFCAHSAFLPVLNSPSTAQGQFHVPQSSRVMPVLDDTGVPLHISPDRQPRDYSKRFLRGWEKAWLLAYYIHSHIHEVYPGCFSSLLREPNLSEMFSRHMFRFVRRTNLFCSSIVQEKY